MNIRTMAFSGVAALAGLGLVGTGAHAVFTTSTSSSQTVQAGTALAYTWSSAAQPGCTTEALAESNGCTAITLTTATVGSTFDTPAYQIGVVNDGTIPVTVSSLGWADTNFGGPTGLGQYLGMCVTGSALGTYSYDNALGSFAPNPYSGFVGANLAVGGTAVYSADFFAGGTSGTCTGGYSNAALPNAVQGQPDTVTLTLGYSG